MTHFDYKHTQHRSEAFYASTECLCFVDGRLYLRSEVINSNGLTLPKNQIHPLYGLFDHCGIDMELVKNDYFRGDSFYQPNLHAFYEEEFE